MHDSAQILAIKLAAWNKEVGAVREWYKDEHANLVTIAGERSKWWVWNRALEASQSSVMQIQTYLQRISQGTIKAGTVCEVCKLIICNQLGSSHNLGYNP